MKEFDAAAQLDIPDDASIANPSRPLVRLRGSFSSVQPLQAGLRRRRDDDGDPLPEDPPEPPLPPPPPVSTPDLAIQLSLCLPIELNDGIVAAVRQALAPDADVRTTCINGSQRIGVWLRPFVNEQDNQRATEAFPGSISSAPAKPWPFSSTQP